MPRSFWLQPVDIQDVMVYLLAATRCKIHQPARGAPRQLLCQRVPCRWWRQQQRPWQVGSCLLATPSPQLAAVQMAITDSAFVSCMPEQTWGKRPNSSAGLLTQAFPPVWV
jgi:hypothetical protein